MREVVSAAFVTGWRAQRPDVPVWLENEAQPTADAYVSLTITPTTSRQMTLGRAGTRRVQRQVYLQVKIWSAKDAGSVPLAALGDVAQGILEMKSFGGSASDEPVITQLAQAVLGKATEHRWSIAIMRIPAWYSETK
ncbi:MAG TPA: hypothetical protein VFQ42_22350 [Mycobacterium sp.]|nr:hypothetical protein [Mycobacterium sp.]